MIRQSRPSNGSQTSAVPPDTGAEGMRRIAPESYLCMVGESEAMRTVREQLRRVAAHFRMVLITGEAGTGKEIVARAMHRLSAQPETQFVSRSAASFLSLVPELLAHSQEATKSPRANGKGAAGEREARSTLFLGDVNALTSGEEIYLLDALPRLEGLRYGGERPRLIFATERDLRALAGAGQFEQKLYRKISAVEIALPSLRSRPGDIAEIAGELMQAVRPVVGRGQRLDKRGAGAAGGVWLAGEYAGVEAGDRAGPDARRGRRDRVAAPASAGWTGGGDAARGKAGGAVGGCDPEPRAGGPGALLGQQGAGGGAAGHQPLDAVPDAREQHGGFPAGPGGMRRWGFHARLGVGLHCLEDK
jgi:hypothetical protein